MRPLAAALVVLATAGVSAQNDAAVSGMTGTYCASCHNGRLRSPGGLLLESFSGAIADRPELWARAYRQLRAGAMPPVGSPRPDQASVDAALTAIERALSDAATTHTSRTSQAVATRLAALLWNAAPD